jgi:hypothetical protein
VAPVLQCHKCMTAIPPMQAAFCISQPAVPMARLQRAAARIVGMEVETDVREHLGVLPRPEDQLDFGLGRLSVAVTEFSAILLSTLAR